MESVEFYFRFALLMIECLCWWVESPLLTVLRTLVMTHVRSSV